MIRGKWKELMLCLRSGVVTAPYPLGPQPVPLPETFRGKVEVDPERCIGCGGCANVCPARVFVLRDIAQDWRVLEIQRERCTYCGRCREVCPENAIQLTPEFELATNDKADLTDRIEIYMSTCQRCGRCFQPPTALERMMEPGFHDGFVKVERPWERYAEVGG